MSDDEITAKVSVFGKGDPLPAGLTEFWRCSTCHAVQSIGAPGRFTKPPRCWAHGEMEQVTEAALRADGWGEDR